MFAEWASPLMKQLHGYCSDLLIKSVKFEEAFDLALTTVSALFQILKSLSIYFAMKTKALLLEF